MSDSDKLVDAFVALINSRPRDLRLKDDVPQSVRVPCDDDDYAGWQIIPSESPWLAELESSLPARLPRTFHSLISRYCFPSIEIGSIVIHGNTAEGTDPFEFRKRLFQDRYMSPFLLQHGFIHFGRPADWSYDPVCFHDSAVVRLDHEEILIRNRVRVTASIASSFRELLQRFITSTQTARR